MVAIAMQVTFEAVVVGTDGRPFASMLHIIMQEELQVLASLDMLIQWSMPLERSTADKSILVSCRIVEHTQVKDLLQLVGTVGVVGDVNLTFTLHVLAVHVVVVLLVLQHLRQVVVVGHTHLYVVRIGLTEVCLGIISQVIAVLIPVERIELRRVFNAVDVTFSVSDLLEEFPSTARYLVGTRCHMRLTDTDERAR